MPYPKLICDRIPAIFAAAGRQFRTTVLTEPAFRTVLLVKRVKEAQEVQAAAPEELLTALVDVVERVDGLLTIHQFTLAQVHEVHEQRRLARGSFENRLQLN